MIAKRDHYPIIEQILDKKFLSQGNFRAIYISPVKFRGLCKLAFKPKINKSIIQRDRNLKRINLITISWLRLPHQNI
jgi:hypothetical protein